MNTSVAGTQVRVWTQVWSWTWVLTDKRRQISLVTNEERQVNRDMKRDIKVCEHCAFEHSLWPTEAGRRVCACWTCFSRISRSSWAPWSSKTFWNFTQSNANFSIQGGRQKSAKSESKNPPVYEKYLMNHKTKESFSFFFYCIRNTSWEIYSIFS